MLLGFAAGTSITELQRQLGFSRPMIYRCVDKALAAGVQMGLKDKLAAIQDLQKRHGATAMTGDDINDAPALAQADIGIAMGASGTETAMEAADVVILNDDLRRIPETIRLSRKTHAVLWQNISLALGIKAVFMVLALLGSATV